MVGVLHRLEDQLSRFKCVNDPRAVSQDEVRPTNVSDSLLPMP